MSSEPSDAGAGVPQSQRTSWTQFVKAIASFSGDLYNMTAPPFILSPVSLTEYPSYWGERPSLFAAIADAPNEEERHVRVLKWFISTLKGQYTTRNDQMGSEKKPLNPALGELFYGHWPSVAGSGEQTLVVEQVSHHPPITAYIIENKSKGLVLQGHNAQKTSFSSSTLNVKQVGHALLTVTLPSGATETHLITLPKLRIEGIWYGSPYVELTENSYIASSSGYYSMIEYKGKGYFTGKSHSFKAFVYPPLPSPASVAASGELPTPSTTPKYVAEGTWTATSKLKDGRIFTDVTGPRTEIIVSDISEQDPMETRRLWSEVSKGIRTGDFDLASREKTKIENAERQKRRDEAVAGTPWKLQHFVRIESDPEYARLGKLFKANPPTEDAWVCIRPESQILPSTEPDEEKN
ncbi:Oxysterol-binding protein [Cantharellus anzutake]|uniref:Oxysterol-binding protein n=1 Tax=Cantharellus anzutake TaxID=1750568 RepID=UPI001908E2E0|nr:Oxysterol-binding protein [Cantharellus anzutake]KAF8335688.1 Oxysterol-binding protein [Cantharellus anzutake]